jgi:uncharacterized coiled-coil DUF342 family protein
LTDRKTKKGNKVRDQPTVESLKQQIVVLRRQIRELKNQVGTLSSVSSAIDSAMQTCREERDRVEWCIKNKKGWEKKSDYDKACRKAREDYEKAVNKLRALVDEAQEGSEHREYLDGTLEDAHELLEEVDQQGEEWEDE